MIGSTSNKGPFKLKSYSKLYIYSWSRWEDFVTNHEFIITKNKNKQISLSQLKNIIGKYGWIFAK